MICTDFTAPMYLIFSNEAPSLLYYSHIPTAFIALLMGFYVFYKNRSLLSRVLLYLSVVFSLWLIANLIVWTNVNSDVIMFVYSIFGILFSLISIFCFYFVYVFINKKDIGFRLKILFGLVVSFTTIFSYKNATGFDLVNCSAIEGGWYSIYYLSGLQLVFFLWILIYGVYKYIKEKSGFRRQILFLIFGVCSFLFSFSLASFLASYLFEKGNIDDFVMEFYGLFGMTFFMGVLAYMIVRFKAFHIKLLGAQALVMSLFIIIASQFAFIQNSTNKVLNLIALVLITGFGYILIKSVKREIAQKEALEIANVEISERKEQLQKISDHLSIANSKLKELDTMKSEFISIVAHQLQGPPTTVKGYSMLLTDGSYGELNADQKDILQKIFNANEQQVAFVDDLLSVSRLESGRVVFNFEKSKIEDICQEVIDNLFLKAKDKSLYLEYIKPTSVILPELNIDRAKIKEAVSNLVDNAIKYTKRGGVRITLKICEEFGEKCLDTKHIRIMVSDTGIGVPADEIPRLFSKFSRGKDVKRLNASGTGLGLYVVKMVVEGNHGKVWIESDGDGKGSKFIMELPID